MGVCEMVLNDNIDLKRLRKDIKNLGFNFRVKKYSNFDYIEFYHIESKKVYPDIFTKDTLVLFDPLIQYCKEKNL